MWGLGDLVIATPFLRAASERFHVTLLAKPEAQDMQAYFWPKIKVVPFTAPWTAFEKKYYLWQWPARELIRTVRLLAREKFDFGVSARRTRSAGDPRDHLLLKIIGAKERIGFSNIARTFLLTQVLPKPATDAHRYENWRIVGNSLGIELPPRDLLFAPHSRREKLVLIHTGARHPVRVWPLERFKGLAAKLRAAGMDIQIVCNPDQESWWRQNGETGVTAPKTVSKLIDLTSQAGVFIGNDSGPGHIAALCGIPTFTIFGPELPEWWVPFYPQAEYIEGKPCPLKPCSDYCRFPKPFCIQDLTENEVWQKVEQFVRRQLPQDARLTK